MREREVKLAAPPGFRLPDLADAADGLAPLAHETLRLETTYWDTPDLRLARWGVSLRHRSDEGWTAKLGAERDGDVLARQEHLFAGDPIAPPADALSLLLPYVRTASLAPVARLRTVRRRVALGNGTGDELAEIVDDEVSVLDGRRLAGRFREVEVELRPALDRETLDLILDRLRAAGALDGDPVPKHVRALGARATAPPEVVPPPVGRGSSIGDVARAALAASVVRLIRHDAAVRAGEDPEDVHQARVATRRLRSDLATFAPVLDPGWADGLRRDLKGLAGALGELRDGDVLVARLRGRIAALPPADRLAGRGLVERATRARAGARRRLMAAINAPGHAELLDRLVEAANAPPLGAATDGAASLMAGPWEDLRTAVERTGRDPTDESLHRVRIAAKRARYAAEAVAPAVGKPAEMFARAAARLQDVLGEHQDSVQAEAWARGLLGKVPATQALVLGELVMLERAAAAEARGGWRKVWKAVKKREPATWT